MNIKALIIDDDPFIKNLLKDKLNQHLPEVNIIDTASSGLEGIKKINQHNPVLIFLDVEMADMTGFEMLNRLPSISFQTIFITSYSHYAIRAIRFNALDYLVKPIDLIELKQAIKRYKKKVENKPTTIGTPVKKALKNFKTQDVSKKTFTLQTHDGNYEIKLEDIIRIEGIRNYSCIYLTQGRKKIASKTLKDLEEIFSDKGFFRCHKSHIINMQHLLFRPTSNSVKLSDDSIVPVSRRKKDEFQSLFEKLKLE